LSNNEKFTLALPEKLRYYKQNTDCVLEKRLHKSKLHKGTPLRSRANQRRLKADFSRTKKDARDGRLFFTQYRGDFKFIQAKQQNPFL